MMRHFIFEVLYLSTQRQREVQKARKQWLLSRACLPENVGVAVIIVA